MDNEKTPSFRLGENSGFFHYKIKKNTTRKIKNNYSEVSEKQILAFEVLSLK
jgi:hypothetical protein